MNLPGSLTESEGNDAGEGSGSGNSGSETTGEEKSGNNGEDDSDSNPSEGNAQQVLAEGNTYKVQDGETLYGICLKIYGNGSMLSEICELNGLEDENKIISGQNLILP